MTYDLGTVGKALQNQLYKILTGDAPGERPTTSHVFLTWCSPGLAFTVNSFKFGEGNNDKESVRRAANFAAVADLIPAVSPVPYVQREGLWQPSGNKLSDVYGPILRQSRVGCLSTADKATHDAAVKNAQKVLDEKVIVEEDGKPPKTMTKRQVYRIYRGKYLAARTAYNKASDDEREQRLGELNDARTAMNDAGYGLQVEPALAVMDNSAKRDLATWKQSFIQDYDNAAFSYGTRTVRAVYPTPSDFAESTGWTEYEMGKSEYENSEYKKEVSWQAGGGFGKGWWDISGEAKGAKESSSGRVVEDSITIKFQLSQVLLVRPWFHPEFLTSTAWKQQDTTSFGPPSSGIQDDGKAPVGSMIGYPERAIFIKDLTIVCRDLADEYSRKKENLNAGGGVTKWGFFNLSGKYSDSQESARDRVTASNGAITVKGIQLIGFVNHLLGKTPNPNPKITQWQ
ncbi:MULTISPECIES: hypothetical protein [unclassified Streptomyces]|uniref:hypothetical protein n=1 Tax=unclassified Streptomyces TaxID=2593676 RepID=UPI0033D1791F